MSNILTDWRRALVALLASDLQGGSFKVVSRRRDGESRDEKIACVFVPRIAQDEGNVNFARPPMVIRAWLPKPRTPKTEEQIDPEPLEQLAVDLCTLLEPVQTTLVPNLYFWVASCDIDDQDWGVQASLVSWTLNPATTSTP